MDRGYFVRTCSIGAVGAGADGALNACPAIAANAKPQLGARVLLFNALGDPLKASSFTPQPISVLCDPFEVIHVNTPSAGEDVVH